MMDIESIGQVLSQQVRRLGYLISTEMGVRLEAVIGHINSERNGLGQ